MYKIHKNSLDQVDSIIRSSDGAYIPYDVANTDYQQFKKAIRR
jgi:hypothetical protein